MVKELASLVLKTILLTLLSIVGVAAVFFFLLSLTAPAAMAKLTLDLGMYKQSAWFAYLQYADGNGNISYIEDAFNRCVYIEYDKGIIEYGTMYIEDERFEEYAAEREEEEAELGYLEVYTQYVYGVISVSYYNTEENEMALELALSVNQDTFDEYNAVTDLITEVMLARDTEYAADIRDALETLQTAGTVKSSDEQGYLETAISKLELFIEIYG